MAWYQKSPPGKLLFSMRRYCEKNLWGKRVWLAYGWLAAQRRKKGLFRRKGSKPGKRLNALHAAWTEPCWTEPSPGSRIFLLWKWNPFDSKGEVGEGAAADLFLSAGQGALRSRKARGDGLRWVLAGLMCTWGQGLWKGVPARASLSLP